MGIYDLSKLLIEYLQCHLRLLESEIRRGYSIHLSDLRWLLLGGMLALIVCDHLTFSARRVAIAITTCERIRNAWSSTVSTVCLGEHNLHLIICESSSIDTRIISAWRWTVLT